MGLTFILALIQLVEDSTIWLNLNFLIKFQDNKFKRLSIIEFKLRLCLTPFVTSPMVSIIILTTHQRFNHRTINNKGSKSLNNVFSREDLEKHRNNLIKVCSIKANGVS